MENTENTENTETTETTVTTENPKKEAKKLDIKRIIIMVLAVAIGTMAGRFIVDGVFSNKNNFDKVLVEVAKELNKNLPMMLDSETRLDTTMAFPGKKYVYYFSLVNYTIDEVDIDIFEEVKQNTINNARTNSDVALFRDNNVTMKYVYRDKNMNEIIQFEVTPKDYK